MSPFESIARRERGLLQQLTAAQMTMIAIGGAIGTGLFMGSAFAIGFAGPSVLISYAIGALIGLLLMGCLAEMTVAHPTSGSFGAYAEHYLSPLAGFVVRYAYWAAVVLAVGMEVTAVGKYMKYWFPEVEQWVWVALFSVILAAYGLLLLGVLVAGAVLRALQGAGAWHLLASPALWLFVAAAWFARGLPAASSLQRVWQSWRQVAPVTGLFIVLGVVMAVSGMAAQLAHALAQGGSAYVFAAPFVGALGGFVTGSNTGANAMFAATQAEIAQALGVAVLPFMAVHNVSAALLLMASPGKVEMACQLVPGAAQAERAWVQSRVLLVTGLAVLLMAALNVLLSVLLAQP